MDYNDFTIQKNTENHFWYKSRREMIAYLFSTVFKNYYDGRLILEVGCGTGYQIPALEKWGKIEAIDINSSAVEVATRNGFFAQVKNIENDALENNKFDVFCLFDVLEHINKDRKVIQKLFLSLKSNGYLFLTVPAYGFMFSNHDKAMSHFRRYDKKVIIDLLEASGFKIIKRGYWNSFLLPGIMLLRLLKNFVNLFIKKESYKSEASNLHPWINYFFYKILVFENFLIKRNISLPFGLSIFVIAKKSC